jgi:TonB-linked SusC/RagA family outer membrane protein
MQQIKVTGKITDASTGEPLPGVNILIEGTGQGVISSVDGIYTIEVPNQQSALIFSYVGFTTERFEVGVRTTIDVVLSPDIQKLDEVVVIGYGTSKKSDLTTAIASVSTSDLGVSASTSIDNMLIGRAPGVDIVSSSGLPGAGTSIKIRGVSTMGNSEPLYVIDGVQFTNSGDAFDNPMNMLNPRDIERIEILKDAAASAIYGTRGANGVILVTTKRGKVGAPKVTFEAKVGFAVVPKKLDVLKAADYRELLIDMQRAANPGKTDEEILGPVIRDEDYSSVDRTNWQDEIFQTAKIQDYNLSVTGGSQFSTYLLSFGYTDQDGIVRDYNFNRYTLRLASDFNIGKWIKIGQNLNFGYTNTVTLPDRTGVVQGALRMAPYAPVYDENNWWGYGNVNNVNDNSNADNPINSIEMRDNLNKSIKLFGNLYCTVDVLRSLQYKASLGIDYSNSHSKTFNRASVNSNEVADNFLEEYYGYGMWPLFEQTLTFSKEIGKHSVILLGGMSVSKGGSGRNSGLSGGNFPNESIQNIMVAQEKSVVNDNISRGASLSYFTRLNYAFMDRYLLTAIFRADASSNFSPSKRWGYFPSFSAAWKLHEEEFITSALPFVTTLKLRAGWGQVGNDNIGNYLYESYLHSNGIVYPFGSGANQNFYTGTTIIKLASPNIKWEKATSTNIGLDLGLLRNKLLVTADYFYKETSDILIDLALPPSAGLGLSSGNDGRQVQNAASVKNKGFELSASYNDQIGEFRYDVSANFTVLKNEVISLGADRTDPISDGVYIYGQAAATRTEAGHPIGAFYGYMVDGIYQTQEEIDTDTTNNGLKYQPAAAPGDLRFKDLDGDGELTDKDRTYIGNPIPKYVYGFSINGAYKNIDIGLSFSGVSKVDVFAYWYTWYMEGMRETGNAGVETLDRWKQPGDNGLPRAVSGDPNGNLRTSNRYIVDGSYLKLRNLTIGYTLPKSWFNTLGLAGSGVRVYFSGQNLLTFTKFKKGYDPEQSALNQSGGGYNLTRNIDALQVPHPRTFLFGVNVNF